MLLRRSWISEKVKIILSRRSWITVVADLTMTKPTRDANRATRAPIFTKSLSLVVTVANPRRKGGLVWEKKEDLERAGFK